LRGQLKITANGSRLAKGVELEFRPAQPLLIENMLMKLRTKVESCLSGPN
jgi:hypothetical protein